MLRFSCFSGENFGTILSRRSLLSRTSRAPSRRSSTTPDRLRCRARPSLDGKNVFQCVWSDPKTRVFESFWVSLCILDGKNVFSVFGQTPKHVFLSVFLGSVLFLPSRRPSDARLSRFSANYFFEHRRQKKDFFWCPPSSPDLHPKRGPHSRIFVTGGAVIA